MSDINPFAYTEELILPQNFSQEGQEPKLPIALELRHKTAFLTTFPCKMIVTEDRFFIAGGHLPSLIVVLRGNADRQVKLRLLDMIIRDDNGQKYRMIYSTIDADRALALARLEAWLYPEKAEDTYTYILNRLKHWTTGLVKNWLIGLTVLQSLALIGVIVAFLLLRTDTSVAEGTVFFMGFMIFWVAGLAMVNCTLLILLKFGRIGALYGVMVVYSIFTLLALVSISIAAILIGGTLVYLSYNANKDFVRLSSRIGINFAELLIFAVLSPVLRKLNFCALVARGNTVTINDIDKSQNDATNLRANFVLMRLNILILQILWQKYFLETRPLPVVRGKRA